MPPVGQVNAGIIPQQLTHQGVVNQSKLGRMADKVVNWFQAKTQPEAYLAKRFSEANSLIRSLANDPRYGTELAHLGSLALENSIGSRKPWSDIVRNVVRDLDNCVQTNKGLNETVATLYSQRGQQFGAIFGQLAQQADLPLQMDKYNTTSLQESIKTAIIAAGNEGRRNVSPQEAQAIARDKVAVFLETKADFYHGVADIQGLSQQEVQTMQSRALRENDWGKPNMSITRLVNTCHSDTVKPQISGMIDQLRQQHGLPQDLNTQKLVYNLERFSVTMHGEPLTSAQALQIARNDIDRFCQQKAAVLQHLDTLNLPDPTKAVLRKTVLQNHLIKTPQYLDQMVALMPHVETLAQDLQQATTDGKFLRGLEKFAGAFAQGLVNAGQLQADKDEMLEFSMGAMEAWLTTQPNGVKNALLDALLSPRGQEVFAGLKAMPVTLGNPTTEVGNQALSRCSDSHIALAALLGEQLHREDDVDVLQQAFVDLTDARRIPDSVYEFGIRNGMELPFRNGVGQSGRDTFNEAFRVQHEQGINHDLSTPGDYNDHLHDELYRDMGRASFKFGNTEVGHASQDDAALGFHLFFGQDTAGKEAVSRIMHQGLFGPIMVNLALSPNGPFQGNVLIQPGDSQTRFEVEQMQDGGYRVHAFMTSTPSGLALAGESPNMVDKAKSHFNLSLSFEIPRASIDNGQPRAQLSDIEYHYSFQK